MAASAGGGSTVWDAGTMSGGASSYSDESDAAVRAGELRKSRDFTPEDAWWRVAVLAREEQGGLNQKSIGFFAAADVLPVLLDLAVFALKSRSTTGEIGSEGAGSSNSASQSTAGHAPTVAGRDDDTDRVEAAVEDEVARRCIAVSLHVCSAASSVAPSLAAEVAPRVGQLMKALSSGQDAALSRLAARLVSSVISVRPSTCSSLASGDVR